MEVLTTATCVVCGAGGELLFPGGHVHHPEHGPIIAGFCQDHCHESKAAGRYWFVNRRRGCGTNGCGCFGEWTSEMGCTETLIGSHNSILR
jgi:hypothetical protein